MQVSDIMLRVKRIFGDESNVQLLDADIIAWINDAQRQISAANDLLQVRAYANQIANQMDYEKPPNILNLHSIRMYGYELLPLALKEADERFFQYDVPGANQVGKPQYYWTWSDHITVYPVPMESITNGITMYYTRQPVPVVLPSDVPELAELYHDRIIDFVLRTAYEMDENIQAANYRQTLFTAGMQQIGERENVVSTRAYEVISIRDDDM